MGLFKRWRENREAKLHEMRQFARQDYEARLAAGEDPDDAADRTVEAVKAKFSLDDFVAFLPLIMELLRVLRGIFQK